MSTLPAPQFTNPAHITGWSVWQITWPSITGAADYQIFLDGVAVSIQRATAGPTQGAAVPVTCGVAHKINVRAGDQNAKNGSPVGWGTLGVPFTWTPPPC